MIQQRTIFHSAIILAMSIVMAASDDTTTLDDTADGSGHLNSSSHYKKHNHQWPRCEHHNQIGCMVGSLQELEIKCDQFTDCSGFTHNGRWGCLKNCGDATNGELVTGAQDYWEKMTQQPQSKFLTIPIKDLPTRLPARVPLTRPPTRPPMRPPVATRPPTLSPFHFNPPTNPTNGIPWPLPIAPVNNAPVLAPFTPLPTATLNLGPVVPVSFNPPAFTPVVPPVAPIAPLPTPTFAIDTPLPTAVDFGPDAPFIFNPPVMDVPLPTAAAPLIDNFGPIAPIAPISMGRKITPPPTDAIAWSGTSSPAPVAPVDPPVTPIPTTNEFVPTAPVAPPVTTEPTQGVEWGGAATSTPDHDELLQSLCSRQQSEEIQDDIYVIELFATPTERERLAFNQYARYVDNCATIVLKLSFVGMHSKDWDDVMITKVSSISALRKLQQHRPNIHQSAMHLATLNKDFPRQFPKLIPNDKRDVNVERVLFHGIQYQTPYGRQSMQSFDETTQRMKQRHGISVQASLTVRATCSSDVIYDEFRIEGVESLQGYAQLMDHSKWMQANQRQHSITCESFSDFSRTLDVVTNLYHTPIHE